MMHPEPEHPHPRPPGLPLDGGVSSSGQATGGPVSDPRGACSELPKAPFKCLHPGQCRNL